MFSRSQKNKKEGQVALTSEAEVFSSGQYDMHQIEVTPTTKGESITSGKIAFFGKGDSSNSEYQPIQKDGVDYELDLSTGIRSFDIPNSSISAVKGVVTEAIVTSAGTWTLNIISGRKG
jgi:hypothetical protein